jgi:hypothetical protein
VCIEQPSSEDFIQIAAAPLASKNAVAFRFGDRANMAATDNATCGRRQNPVGES